MAKKYDYVASNTDSRDYIFKLGDGVNQYNSKASAYKLPPNRLESQGQIGACTAFGITSAFERLVTVVTNETTFQASPMFNYTNSRLLDADTLNDDNGTTLRSACSNLRLVGVCRDETWPYNLTNLALTPSVNAYNEARRLAQSVNYFEVIRSLDALKALIGDYGYYVSIGFMVYPGFESDATTKTGDVPDPSASETNIGGHCVNLYGWDDTKRRFYFLNQYGKNWGAEGAGTISYDYVLNTSLTPEIKVLFPTDQFATNFEAFKQKYILCNPDNVRRSYDRYVILIVFLSLLCLFFYYLYLHFQRNKQWI